MISYYKLNNKVLEFDVNKDVDLIRLNHYLMQKENLQRLKGELGKGQLYLSTRNISKDLNISLAKAQRMIKKFIELEIIKPISLSKSSTQASVYFYLSISETVNDTVFDAENKTVKLSKINTHSKGSDTVVETKNETVFDTSKKELLKISCCSCLEEPHLNLENEIVEGAFQQKLDLEDERVALVKSYGFKVSNVQEKMIQTLDKDRLLQAIEITVAQEGKSFSYIYKVYLNNKKAPTTGIVDASSSNAQSTKTKIKKSIAKKSRKDKSIYMCSTKVEFEGKIVDTEDLSESEFERLIEEKQKLKWA
ncbi:hypothetical protein [Romboutsia sp.]|uniref:hypothetical protein n=1 Tax=Romboutsia sp. TaxID=1965302 RepID=UPI003F3AB77F